jgi:hypothetical protein
MKKIYTFTVVALLLSLGIIQAQATITSADLTATQVSALTPAGRSLVLFNLEVENIFDNDGFNTSDFLNSITFTYTGTDGADIEKAMLVRDENTNGVYDSGDIILAQDVTVMNNTLVFSDLNDEILEEDPAFKQAPPVYYLVVAKLKVDITDGNVVDLKLNSQSVTFQTAGDLPNPPNVFDPPEFVKVDSILPKLEGIVWADTYDLQTQEGYGYFNKGDKFVFTFSEPMRTTMPGTINTGNVNTVMVVANRTLGPNDKLFGTNPDVMWNENNKVTVTLINDDFALRSGDQIRPSSSVQDIAGNGINQAQAAIVIKDDIGPVLNRIAHQNMDALATPPNTKISAGDIFIFEFSEPMADTITSANVNKELATTIGTGYGSNPTVVRRPDGKVFEVTLSANFNIKDGDRVLPLANVTDMAGNPCRNPVGIPLFDQAGPQLVSIDFINNDGPNDTGFSGGDYLEFTFSEPIPSTAITTANVDGRLPAEIVATPNPIAIANEYGGAGKAWKWLNSTKGQLQLGINPGIRNAHAGASGRIQVRPAPAVTDNAQLKNQYDNVNKPTIYIIDNVRPTLLRLAARGALDPNTVPPTVVRFYFSEPMDNSTIALANFQVTEGHTFGTGAALAPVAGTSFTVYQLTIGANATVINDDKVNPSDLVLDQQGIVPILLPERNKDNTTPPGPVLIGKEPPELQSITFSDNDDSTDISVGDTLSFKFNNDIRRTIDPSNVNQLLQWVNVFGHSYNANYGSTPQIVYSSDQTTVSVVLGSGHAAISGMNVNPSDNVTREDIDEFLRVPDNTQSPYPVIKDNVGPRLETAIYSDVNGNGVVDKGDTISLTFSEAVEHRTKTPPIISVNDFDILPNVGANPFGTGAKISPTLLSDTKTITLGTNPKLTDGVTINPTDDVSDDYTNQDATPAGGIRIANLVRGPQLVNIAWNQRDASQTTFSAGDQLIFTFDSPMDTSSITYANINARLPLPAYPGGGTTYDTGTASQVVWEIPDDPSGPSGSTKLLVTLGQNAKVPANATVNPTSDVKGDDGRSDATPAPVPINENKGPKLLSIIWTDKDSSTDITATDTLAFNFSEPINKTGITTANLPLTPAHTYGTTVVAFSSDQKVITVTLGAGTTVATGDTVNPTVVDLANNPDASAAITIRDDVSPKLLTIAVTEAVPTDDIINAGDSIVFTFTEVVGDGGLAIVNAARVDALLAPTGKTYAAANVPIAAGKVLTVILGAGETIDNGDLVNPSSALTDVALNPDATPAAIPILLPPTPEPYIVGVTFKNNDGPYNTVISAGDQFEIIFSSPMDTTTLTSAVNLNQLGYNGAPFTVDSDAGVTAAAFGTNLTVKWSANSKVATITLGANPSIVSGTVVQEDDVVKANVSGKTGGPYYLTTGNWVRASGAIRDLNGMGCDLSATPVALKDTVGPVILPGSIIFIDMDKNTNVSAGDQYIIGWSENVDTSTVTNANLSQNLALGYWKQVPPNPPIWVKYGSWGSGASVVWSGSQKECTVTLGTNPIILSLKDIKSTDAAATSGIEVRSTNAVKDIYGAGSQMVSANLSEPLLENRGPVGPQLTDTVEWFDRDSSGTLNDFDMLKLAFSEDMDESTITIANLATTDGKKYGTNANVGPLSPREFLITLGKLGKDPVVAGSTRINPKDTVKDIWGNPDATPDGTKPDAGSLISATPSTNPIPVLRDVVDFGAKTSKPVGYIPGTFNINANTALTIIANVSPLPSINRSTGKPEKTTAVLLYREGGDPASTEVKFEADAESKKWKAVIPSAKVSLKGVSYKVVQGANETPEFIVPVQGTITSFEYVDPWTSATHNYPAYANNPKNFRIVSVPLNPTPKEIEDAHKEIPKATDEFFRRKTVFPSSVWGTEGTDWQIFFYSTPLQDYVNGADPNAPDKLPDYDKYDAGFVPGRRAAWLQTMASHSITIEGVSVDPVNKFQIVLQPGWNLIANPYFYQRYWDDSTMTVTKSGTNLTLTQARDAGWMSNKLYQYEGDDFGYRVHSTDASEQTLPLDTWPGIFEPWRGGWVYAATSGLTLMIDPLAPGPNSVARPPAAPVVSRPLSPIAAALNNMQPPQIPFVKVATNLVPDENLLLQNYPNPFNPETWIPFAVTQDTDVTIRIYNVSGQLVRKLNLGRLNAGYYVDKSKSAYWDGKNSRGESVASGVYFYQIRAGDFSASKKLVILK